MTEEGEPVAAMIDGTDSKSWRLPLPPLSTTSLPEPYSHGDNPALDCLEASAKMVGVVAVVVLVLVLLPF